MSANPLTYAEIDAWSRQMHKAPKPWEIRVLKRLDAAFMAHVAEVNKPQKAK